MKTVLFLVAALGLTDTIYLLSNHFFFQGQCQILPLNLTILGNDCGTVTTSTYGTIATFPLSIWGSIGYVMIMIFTILSFRWKSFFWITLILSVSGALISWILTWVQYALIQAYCPLCLLSMILMTMIFILAIFSVILSSPPNLSGAQIIISILLGGFIISSVLLTYKLIEDKLSFLPSSAKQTKNSYNFPSGIILENIIYLKDIDQVLKSNLNSENWETISKNQELYGSILEELRKKTLYLLALEFLADQEQKSISTLQNEVLDSILEAKNLSWNEFISEYLAIADLLQNTNQSFPSPSLDFTRNPLTIQYIEFINSRIDIEENIPPSHLIDP